MTSNDIKERPERRKLTSESLIEKARAVHGDKYTYLIEPNQRFKKKDKIDILCKTHGVFSQRIDGHLSGQDCRLCKRMEKFHSDNNPLHKKLVEKHKDLYDIENLKELKINAGINHASPTVTFTCEQHGTVTVSLRRVLKHKDCPICVNPQPSEIHRNRSAKEIYYKEVQRYTNESWKHKQGFFNHYNLKRGINAYSLDHIYSIDMGFKNNVHPALIGHWMNLRLIPRSQNSAKGRKSEIDLEHLIKDYNWACAKFNEPNRLPPEQQKITRNWLYRNND